MPSLKRLLRGALRATAPNVTRNNDEAWQECQGRSNPRAPGTAHADSFIEPRCCAALFDLSTGDYRQRLPRPMKPGGIE
jgi:hypothetical protein